MAVEGVTSPTQIYGELDRLGHIDAGGSPSPRTIQRLIARLKTVDVSGPWSFAQEEDPEDARLALEVLAQVYDRTDGRVWLTKEVAAWVIRLRRAEPEMPASWAYVLAWQYLAAESAQREQDEPMLLDLVVALQPWAIRGGAAGEAMSGFGGDRAVIRWWDEDSSPALRKLWPFIDELEALVKDIERVPRSDFGTPVTTPIPANNGEQARTQQRENR
jgi:hypothetical protein